MGELSLSCIRNIYYDLGVVVVMMSGILNAVIKDNVVRFVMAINKVFTYHTL